MHSISKFQIPKLQNFKIPNSKIFNFKLQISHESFFSFFESKAEKNFNARFNDDSWTRRKWRRVKKSEEEYENNFSKSNRSRMTRSAVASDAWKAVLAANAQKKRCRMMSVILFYFIFDEKFHFNQTRTKIKVILHMLMAREGKLRSHTRRRRDEWWRMTIFLQFIRNMHNYFKSVCHFQLLIV